MIATILIYSLFITNPTGTLGPHPEARTPYFFAEETQMREYESYEQCEEDAKKVRADLSAKLNDLYKAANSAEKQADYRVKQAKYESLKCASVKRQIDTAYANTADGSKPFTVQPDKKAQPQMTLAYRIGRTDSNNQFYGTEYNKYAYSTKPKCDEAYQKTQANVITKATVDGADAAGLVEVLMKFNSTYRCMQVQVDPEEKLDQTPPAVVAKPRVQEAAAPAQPVPAPQNVVVQAQPIQQPVQQYAPAPNEVTPQMEMMPAPMPTQGYVQNHAYYSGKRYTISELIYYPNGMTTRAYYNSYPSVVLCNQALQIFLMEDEQRIYARYAANQSMAGYEYYRAQLSQLQRRRSSMSCVA